MCDIIKRSSHIIKVEFRFMILKGNIHNLSLCYSENEGHYFYMGIKGDLLG